MGVVRSAVCSAAHRPTATPHPRTTQESSPQVPIDVGGRAIDFDSTITIAREARMLAGFTDEEIERLLKAASRSAAY